MSQYAFSLKLAPVFSADNFFVSQSNEAAHRWIMLWPDWPSHALLLSAPQGCGKTHLGHIWAARAGAQTIAAVTLPSPESLQSHLLLEDLETAKDERALLHLFNYTKEKNLSLLMTSNVPAAQLPFTLPDLTSRLKGAQSTHIDAPDDALLAAAIRKQFADRQWKVSDDIVDYIVPRMDRSLTQAMALVEKLDNASLEQKRELTIPLVKQALGW